VGTQISEDDRIAEERRNAILEGVGDDLSDSEIAARLGMKRWEIRREVRLMRENMDKRLLEAERRRKEIRSGNEKRREEGAAHSVLDARFQRMGGMDLQRRSFLNMIGFYEADLRRVLAARDEKIAVMALPRSVRRVLTNNAILDHGRVTTAAREAITRGS
jgi:IS30 family transposase